MQQPELHTAESSMKPTPPLQLSSAPAGSTERPAKKIGLGSDGAIPSSFATTYVEPNIDEPTSSVSNKTTGKRKMGDVEMEEKAEMIVNVPMEARGDWDLDDDYLDLYDYPGWNPEKMYSEDVEQEVTEEVDTGMEAVEGGHVADLEGGDAEVVQDVGEEDMEIEKEEGEEEDMDVEDDGQEMEYVDPVTITILDGYVTEVVRNSYGVDKLADFGVNTCGVVVGNIQESDFDGLDDIYGEVAKMFLICGPLRNFFLVDHKSPNEASRSFGLRRVFLEFEDKESARRALALPASLRSYSNGGKSRIMSVARRLYRMSGRRADGTASIVHVFRSEMSRYRELAFARFTSMQLAKQWSEYLSIARPFGPDAGSAITIDTSIKPHPPQSLRPFQFAQKWSAPHLKETFKSNNPYPQQITQPAITIDVARLRFQTADKMPDMLGESRDGGRIWGTRSSHWASIRFRNTARLEMYKAAIELKGKKIGYHGVEVRLGVAFNEAEGINLFVEEMGLTSQRVQYTENMGKIIASLPPHRYNELDLALATMERRARDHEDRFIQNGRYLAACLTEWRKAHRDSKVYPHFLVIHENRSRDDPELRAKEKKDLFDPRGEVVTKSWLSERVPSVPTVPDVPVIRIDKTSADNAPPTPVTAVSPAVSQVNLPLV